MSKYQHQTLHAPAGVDLVTDPPSIAEARAQHVEGFFPARYGVLAPSYALQPLRKSGVLNWQSLFYFHSPRQPSPAEYAAGRLTHDWIIGTVQSTVFAVPVEHHRHRQQVVVTEAPAFLGDMSTVEFPPPGIGWSFRGLQVGDELLLCATWGSYLWRVSFNKAIGSLSLHPVGLPSPAFTDSGTLHQFAGGSLTPTSYYQYCLTFEDERGRESSPNLPVGTTLTGSNQTIRVHWKSSYIQSYTQIHYLNVYRTLAGGGVFYRVARRTRNQALAQTNWTDTMSDSVAAGQVTAPLPNQNDPPDKASIIAFHKNRVWLNLERPWTQYSQDSEALSTIQVSNLNSITQFSRADLVHIPVSGQSLNVTDGTRLIVDGDQRGRISGLISVGSAMCVWKDYGMWLVWGDDPTTFSIQAVHRTGCIAPDTVTNFRGSIVWRGPDGIYSTNGSTGFTPRLISHQIEPVFRGEYPWVRLKPNA